MYIYCTCTSMYVYMYIRRGNEVSLKMQWDIRYTESGPLNPRSSLCLKKERWPLCFWLFYDTTSMTLK